MAHYCFCRDCKLEVQYVCLCLSSVTYCCELHLQIHLKLRNRCHTLDSILAEPPELTKDSILKFLEKEKSKREKLMKIVKGSSNHNWKNNENNIKSSLNGLKEINSLIEMISLVSLSSLITQHDADLTKAVLSNNLDEYARVNLFCRLGQLNNKKFEILNRANNDLDTEQDFRRTCSLYENNASDSLISQAYKEYISEYQKFTSCYLAYCKRMYIYNTETEKEEVKVLENLKKFDHPNVLVQLPNAELLFICQNNSFRVPYILDRNYKVRKLQNVPSEFVGATYFNRSIYFHGQDIFKALNSSWKLDLDENRWSRFAPILKNIYCFYNSVVFNRNILISCNNCKICLYSIDIDSFSEIPYSFANCKKFLIKSEESLYLIESNRWIYESEDLYDWKKIARSIIPIYYEQVYSSYNKGGIYIMVISDSFRNYFKFDLNRKTLIEIAFYGLKIGLKRSGDNLEAIDSYRQTFILNPSYAATYVDKGYTLFHIGQELERIEALNEKIEFGQDILDILEMNERACAWMIISDIWNHPKEIKHYNEIIRKINKCIDAYNEKGTALQNLGRHLDAIEWYNKAIKLKFIAGYTFDNKESIYYYREAYRHIGFSLSELGRQLEAIECYNEAIQLHPDDRSYFNKGIALGKLTRNLEAIESYDKAIELKSVFWNAYNNKGETLMNLGRYIEAIECFSKLIIIKPDCAQAYNNKGEAFYSLNRYNEAIECYNKAINIEIFEPKFYCNRANALSKLGRQIEALQDFSKADNLMKNSKQMNK